MRIIKARDYEDVSRKAANIIFSVMTEKPDCVMGLATGSSPLGIYKELVRHYQEGDLDFSRVTTVNLDEYRGLDRENPQSYAYYMRENFFSKVNIRLEKTFLPDGTQEDRQKACEEYDQILSQAGQQDIQLLGIGHDGHIGFNEPADHFPKGTHCVDLAESTIEANARFFESQDQVPMQAYTMGIQSIMSAKRILMVANGKEKARILKQAFQGPVTPQVPASILQLHPQVILVADEEALSEMENC
ncbi:MAG TPA: glucosamine-6-phosphate deaminase [Candidatus Blautia avicola]|uniref:Glucosamine-6-phosphate deaminase n=1 Tax=Candidatus Blautia avicola TaxID=2838483 RepID=A0A9D2QQX7_9FIRM|nr:glucosamine-6-phosphate deaminase [Candidatus Blautia avicola]